MSELTTARTIRLIKAEGWDAAHRQLCEYVAMGCLLHANPYRTTPTTKEATP